MTDCGVVLVVGMHRSGTSSLTGTLQSAGLYLGDVVEAAPHNPKGNRENKQVMKLNEAVLEANGGSWRSPPERIEWRSDHLARRDEIIAGYRTAARWGMKDPRFLLLLDGWLSGLPPVQLIGTIRNPASVVNSLMRRNAAQGTEEKFLRLWHCYNAHLLTLWRKAPFPLVDFDTEPEGYMNSLVRVCEWLGLDGDSGRAFFEAGLRTAQSDSGSSVRLSEETRALHSELQQAARIWQNMV
ncbi:MAG: sulfotransferase family protein [Pseudomonadota bacterium]